MKKCALAVVAAALAITAVAVLDRTATAEPNAPETESAIPISLDNLYPPKAPAPLFLIAKIEMATRFSGIVGDLFENDPANAQGNYETFKKQYAEMSQMVPEWRESFPLGPIDELGAAMKTGEQPKVMAALEKVGAVCHTCHVQNMARVQQKYHWGDFEGLSVTDPLTGEEVSFPRLMLAIEINMAGVGINLEQGQKENAQKQLAGFKARFAAFKETCQACHDSERKYFVDASIDGMVDRLAAQLEQSTPDPKAVGELLHGIGQESCSKCHLVHIPAAYAQARLPEGHLGMK
jgi:cytochrome c556